MSPRRAALLAALAAGALAGCGSSADSGGPAAGSPVVPAAACVKGTPRVARAVALQRGVGALLVDGETLWAANSRSGRVTAIPRAADGPLRSIPGGRTPVALAAQPGQLWVADRDGDAVKVLDPQSGKEIQRFSFGAPISLQRVGSDVWALSLDDGVMYGLTRKYRLVAERTINVSFPIAMTPVRGAMWILGSGDNGLAPLSLREGRFGGEGVRLPAKSVAGLGEGGGALWVTDPRGGQVVFISENGLGVEKIPAPTGFAPSSIAYDACGIWVASTTGQVARLDPDTLRWTHPRTLARGAAGLVDDGRGAWLADPVAGRVLRLEP